MLALAFSWAGIAKLSRFERWRSVLAGYGLADKTVPAAAILVPLAELAVAFVTIAASVQAGALGAAILLALFSVAILRARAVKGDRLPCGCFGGSAERHYSTMMMRNLGLGALAAIALLGEGTSGPVLSALPSRTDLLPAVLVLLGLALVLWVASQTSRSLQRKTDGR